VVNIANVPSRENSATLRQRAAEGLALRDELGERSVRIYFERDGLPNRFVFDAREEAGKPTGHLVPQPTFGPSTDIWSLNRGERNNESKIGKNCLLRSKYPQSEDHAIAAFRGNDVAPECRFIYDPF
jgi:hypothetical protein